MKCSLHFLQRFGFLLAFLRHNELLIQVDTCLCLQVDLFQFCTEHFGWIIFGLLSLHFDFFRFSVLSTIISHFLDVDLQVIFVGCLSSTVGSPFPDEYLFGISRVSIQAIHNDVSAARQFRVYVAAVRFLGFAMRQDLGSSNLDFDIRFQLPSERHTLNTTEL